MFYTNITFYSNSSPVINDFRVQEFRDESSFYHSTANYTLLLKVENTTVFQGGAAVSFIRYGGYYNEPSGSTTAERVTKTYRLPYRSNATIFVIRHEGNEVASVNLTSKLCTSDGVCSAYCRGKGIDLDCTCGNGVCDANENVELCRQDCAEEPDQNDTTEPVDEPGDGIDQQQDGRGFFNIAAIVLILIVAGGLLYYFVQEVEVQ